MHKPTQVARAEAFRKLHDRTHPLLLPNAWDAGSAALFAHRGFAAIATTSGGMAWSLGYQDGQRAPLEAVLAATARITRVVDLPVSVDLETGYGDTPDQVADSVRGVIHAGAVGINLEDSLPGHGPLRAPGMVAARIQAARTAASSEGVPIVINARVDVWMKPEAADPSAVFDEAVRRARAYLAAGADTIFVLGLVDRDVLARLAHTLSAPINVAALPGLPNLRELTRIGVARISTATRFATLALGAVDRAVTSLLQDGDLGALDSNFGYADAQRLFAHA